MQGFFDTVCALLFSLIYVSIKTLTTATKSNNISCSRITMTGQVVAWLTNS